MILSDQLREVKRLDQIRIKNEQMVSMEELQGKYQKSYRRLLNILSNQNKMAVGYCREVFHQAIEYLERGTSIYDTDERMDVLREYYQLAEMDPFARKILKAVTEAFEDRDREDI